MAMNAPSVITEAITLSILELGSAIQVSVRWAF